MLKYIKNLLLFVFNLIDRYYHQKNIAFFLKRKVDNVDTFFDVGSHLGTYTDFVRKIYPNCKSFLFEPQSEIFKKIEQKYSNNKSINIFNLAISDTEQKRNLNLNKHDLTSTFSDFNKKSSYLNFKAKLFETDIEKMSHRVESVQTITLDKFIIENNIEKIDLLKIDTEGHELNVLNGLKKKIDIVNNILIEVHHRQLFLSYNADDIHKFLILNGFELKKSFKFPFCWVDRLYTRLK